MNMMCIHIYTFYSHIITINHIGSRKGGIEPPQFVLSFHKNVIFLLMCSDNSITSSFKQLPISLWFILLICLLTVIQVLRTYVHTYVSYSQLKIKGNHRDKSQCILRKLYAHTNCRCSWLCVSISDFLDCYMKFNNLN